MATWTTPKTNWTRNDYFSHTDYNRIKNNLVYINDMLNEMYPDKAVELDLGDDLTYGAEYPPSKFNALENALESFTRVGSNVSVGDKKTFRANESFIESSELNRLESCCIRWHDFTPPTVNSLEISPSARIMKVGDSYTFTVSCTPPNADDKEDYTITSSDTSVLSVVKNGMSFVANAISEGVATITASINSVSTTATIQVDLVTVTGITPSQSSVTLSKLQSTIIDLEFTPADAINVSDWTVSANNDTVSVLRLNDRQIQITGNKSSSTSVVTITCGEVTSTINVTTAVGIDDLWVSDVRMDSLYEGRMETHCPRVSYYGIRVDTHYATLLYAIVQPYVSLLPDTGFIWNDLEVTFSDPTVCRRIYTGTNDILKIQGLRQGNTVMTVSTCGLSWDVSISTY